MHTKTGVGIVINIRYDTPNIEMDIISKSLGYIGIVEEF
jgi:hypothetical protein